VHACVTYLISVLLFCLFKEVVFSTASRNALPCVDMQCLEQVNDISACLIVTVPDQSCTASQLNSVFVISNVFLNFPLLMIPFFRE
jgi:hypothetical protein